MSVNFQSLVDQASNWTLAGNADLLKVMENVAQNILDNAERTNNNLNELMDSLDETSVQLDLVRNRFLGLQNTQFIESRVYEEDESAAADKPTEAKSTEPLDDIASVVARGLSVLEKHYDKIEISDSESEEDTVDFYSKIILQPKDPYSHRALPSVIGSEKWYKEYLVANGESSDEAEAEEENGNHTADNYSIQESVESLPVNNNVANDSLFTNFVPADEQINRKPIQKARGDVLFNDEEPPPLFYDDKTPRKESRGLFDSSDDADDDADSANDDYVPSNKRTLFDEEPSVEEQIVKKQSEEENLRAESKEEGKTEGREDPKEDKRVQGGFRIFPADFLPKKQQHSSTESLINSITDEPNVTTEETRKPSEKQEIIAAAEENSKNSSKSSIPVTTPKQETKKKSFGLFDDDPDDLFKEDDLFFDQPPKVAAQKTNNLKEQPLQQQQQQQKKSLFDDYDDEESDEDMFSPPPLSANSSALKTAHSLFDDSSSDEDLLRKEEDDLFAEEKSKDSDRFLFNSSPPPINKSFATASAASVAKSATVKKISLFDDSPPSVSPTEDNNIFDGGNDGFRKGEIIGGRLFDDDLISSSASSKDDRKPAEKVVASVATEDFQEKNSEIDDIPQKFDDEKCPGRGFNPFAEEGRPSGGLFAEDLFSSNSEESGLSSEKQFSKVGTQKSEEKTSKKLDLNTENSSKSSAEVVKPSGGLFDEDLFSSHAEESDLSSEKQFSKVETQKSEEKTSKKLDLNTEKSSKSSAEVLKPSGGLFDEDLFSSNAEESDLSSEKQFPKVAARKSKENPDKRQGLTTENSSESSAEKHRLLKEDLFSSSTEEPNPLSENLFAEVSFEKIEDSKEEVMKKEPQKEIGKLKPNLLNINVNALLPGTRPLKKATQELASEDNRLESQQQEENSSIVPTANETTEESSDQEQVQVLQSMTKNRVRVLGKRRPPTRAGRTQITANSSLTLKEPSAEVAKIENIEKTVAITSDHSKRAPLEKSVATATQKPKETVAGETKSKKQSLFSDSSSSDEEKSLFSATSMPKLKPKETAIKKKVSLFSDDDEIDDDDLFKDTKPSTKAKQKQQKSLFDDDDDDDDNSTEASLFTSSANKNVKTSGKPLDDPLGLL